MTERTPFCVCSTFECRCGHQPRVPEIWPAPRGDREIIKAAKMPDGLLIELKAALGGYGR